MRLLVRGEGNTQERPPGIPTAPQRAVTLGFRAGVLVHKKMEGEKEGFVSALGSQLWQKSLDC